MSLIGDSVNTSYSILVALDPFDPTNETEIPVVAENFTVVDPGLEIDENRTFDLLGLQIGGEVKFDIAEKSFELIVTNSNSFIPSLPKGVAILSDLDFDTGETIANVTSTGLPVDSIEFTDDSITVTIPELTDINQGDEFAFSFDITTECFLAGTNILTNKGEVPIEKLKIGDIVKTTDGKLEPILWIGRQTIEPNRVKNPIRSLPVLVKEGALGNNLPHKDLYISPDHALLVDGLLINAGALVNDISILKTEPTETFVYYHIELENHSLLVVEGTSAESYLPQREKREEYDNADEFDRLYPHGSNLMLWPMDYPRVSSRSKVPRFVAKRLKSVGNNLSKTETQLTRQKVS